jgi:hypothetical protein
MRTRLAAAAAAEGCDCAGAGRAGGVKNGIGLPDELLADAPAG